MFGQGRNSEDIKTDMYQAILSLQTMEECYRFFNDLCTVKELQSMEQRYQVAQLLDAGMVYTDILNETGASSATISRVNRCLLYGADGYRLALDREKKQKEENEANAE